MSWRAAGHPERGSRQQDDPHARQARYQAQRSTSGSSRRAISNRPLRVSGCRAGQGCLGASQRMMPPSFMRALAARKPACRFSWLIREARPGTAHRPGPGPRPMGVDDGPDAVGVAAARHGSGGASVQVGQQRDPFLAVPRAFDGLAAQLDELAQFRRRAAVSILKYDTCSISRAMRARKAGDIGVPATGASWIMMGMRSASDRVA